MHTADAERLQQMCGSHELPEKLKQLYDVAQHVWHRISSGPLSEQVLMMLVIQAEAVSVPEPEESIWDKVEPYTAVIVSQNGETPYEAEYVRRKYGKRAGELEIRLFGDDEFTRPVLARFVRLKDQSNRLAIPERFKHLQEGDIVTWAPVDGEVQDAAYVGIEPDGKVFLKTGKNKSKFTYVPADEVIVPEPAEVG